MRPAPRPAVIALAPLAALALGVAPAAAHPAAAPPPQQPTVVVEGLVTPLSFDVTPRGDLYVAQAFAGVLTHVTKAGDQHVLAVAAEGSSVGAVSVAGGTVTWAERAGDGPVVVDAVLHRRAADGTHTVAEIFAYEVEANPDQVNTYGIQGLTDECAAAIPEEIAPFVLPYTGVPDSNPYASVTVGTTTYVADAGANAILAVSADGVVSTAAVLPPVPITLTAAAAEGLGLPECVVGLQYWAEPVPTDVEVGRGGWLYVTSLPGGPEDDSLGANGAVYRVDPATGAVELVARGFVGATDLAVAPNGTIYVTELFADRLSAITRTGEIVTVADLAMPAAVEWQKGRLYVATQVFGNGTIVALTPGR
ncbi:MAG: ScyD/ScyE family protein [Actinotalea sp.]|nr:ScyD/ScyE family protein [Actinotalea sp.]